MVEVSSGAPGSPSSANQPAQASQATQDPPQYVTKAELQEILQRLDGISGKVGGLANDVKGIKATAPATANAANAADANEPRLSLAKVDEQQQKFASGLKANAKRTEIKAAVAEKLGKKTDSFAKYVLNVYGEQFEVTDDMQVYVKDNGERTPVGQWADAFLKTDEGLMFMPPPAQPPSGEGLEGGNGNGKKAHHPYSSLNYEQLMDKQRTDFAGVQKFAREHPEDYARIKNRR